MEKKKNQNLRLPFTPQLPTLSTTIMGTRQHHLQLASSWQLPYPIKTCLVPAKAPWSYRWSLRPPPLHLLLQPSLVTNPLTRTFIADHHELRQPFKSQIVVSPWQTLADQNCGAALFIFNLSPFPLYSSLNCPRLIRGPDKFIGTLQHLWRTFRISSSDSSSLLPS